MFRLIENRKAKNPYYHESISVHLYTLEELCFFLETHMYLIDASWVGEKLFSWLEKELSHGELALRLRQILRRTKNIFLCVEEILRSSGNYSEEELSQIHEQLDGMNGKTPMVRRKMRGDLFLDEKKYRQAAYIYLELLQPEYLRQMTEELQGNVYHNLGVAYARMFLFPEAAQMFYHAYQLRKTDHTRQAYLFAMNYISGNDSLEEQGMDLSFSVMKNALNQLTEIGDQPEYYHARKAASQAADAFDWKAKQIELIFQWKSDYKKYIG